MSVSTVPAAKAKILELLQQDVGLTGVAVDWSEPVKDHQFKRVNVWFGDTTEQEEEWKALGAQRKEETYSFPLVVQVHGKNDTAQSVEGECWGFLETVKSLLRADITLEDTLNLWEEGNATAMTTGPTAEGFLSRGTVTVTCRARI